MERVALRSLAFDHLPALGALLDGTGQIIDTNEAWRLFTQLNGGDPEATGVGVSYLEVCERAAVHGGETARRALTGLREILAGSSTRFELEYSCASPDEDRWFRLSFFAGSIAHVAGVVVHHVDITADKMLEQGLIERLGHDPLEALGDRAAAVQFLRSYSGTEGPPVTVLSVGLDSLGSVNATFGRSVGDQVLVQISNRLRRAATDDGLVCRVHRGEFLLVFPEDGPTDPEARAAALRRTLARSFQVGADRVTIDIAIGSASTAEFPVAERLLHEAGTRMSCDQRDRSVHPAAHSGMVAPPSDIDLSWTAERPLPPVAEGTAPVGFMVAELRALQAMTDAVLEHATDLVLFFAGDGTITWASPACERVFGVERASLVGRNGFDLVHVEDRDRVFSDFLTIPDLGDSVRTEFRVIGADHAVRWVDEVATNLLDEPDVGMVVGHLRDVTTRKEAEAAVQLQARLLGAAGQAIVAHDMGMRVIYWNPAAEALYGWSAKEAIGRLLTDLTPPADGWLNASRAAGKDISDGTPWSGELLLITRSGTSVPVRMTATPVIDDAGERSATIIVSHDISRQISNQAMAARLAAVVDSSTDAIISADSCGVITTWNRSAEELFGRETEAAIGMHVVELVSSDTSSQLGQAVREVAAGLRVNLLAAVGQRKDDTTFHASISLSPIAPEVGSVAGVSMIVRDVSEIIERRAEGERDRKRLADAQALAGLGSFEIDLRTGDVSRSDELWRILGREPGSPGVEVLSCVHAEDREAVRTAFDAVAAGGWAEPMAHRIVRPSGDVRWVLSQTSRSRLAPDLISGTSLDITERHLTRLALAHQAHHDPLTGLPNRRRFLERLESALEHDLDTGLRTAVLFIDLDDFKSINDKVGHHSGDKVLKATGDRIDGALEPGDTMARLGGDEFVVCCGGINDIADVRRSVDRIQAALRMPLQVDTESFNVSTSIGVALSRPGSLADALLRDADAAMYSAKQQGPGRVELFDESISDQSAHRRAAIAELEHAIDSGQISTYFQPEVELRTGQLIGFEALARWIHPQRGLVSPGEFIALAESSGLIHDLGRLVLADACKAMAMWSTRHPEQKLTVSVNVSPLQLADQGLPEDVRSAIASASVPPGRVCLEMTETALMDVAVAVEALRRFKEVGVLIAIDDFGTGYSSLSRLKRFPVDFLKIDQSFVAGLGRDPEDELIVTAVTQLAHSMGIQVIAEGIETQDQLDILAKMGCEFGQGFLWSRAMPLDDLWPVVDGRQQLQHLPELPAPKPPAGEGR